MDLIHADADRLEIGVLTDYIKIDMEISSEADVQKNSFEISMDEYAWTVDPIETGHYIYCQGEEWGGRVEYLKHSTKTGSVLVGGTCWRGMLARKVVEPPSGEAYRNIRNVEANAAIRTLIGDKFGDLITVPSDNSGIAVSGSFRYTNLLEAIQSMLSAAGGRLSCGYDSAEKKVIIQAEKATSYVNQIELSQDYGIYLTSTQGRLDAYNHLIALGRGELTDREVVHLYRLADGTITQKDPGNRGVEDICEVYDYSNAESLEELIKGAEKRLKEYAPTASIEMDLSEAGIDLKMGDVVATRDYLTGLSASASVTHKLLTITAQQEKIETEVG